MDESCRIRPARSADIPALTALEPRCFSDPWSGEGFAEMLASPGVFGLVAERNGTIDGYLVARVVADEGEILNLAVAPERRRRGIAQALLGEVLDRVETRGARNVFLEVRASNQAAIALYQGQGFLPAGRRRAYYRRPLEDAVVLRRSVGGG